ncbi:Ig-like domain-containing protein, partial [Salmonella enterica]|uniref:Ig-like domain-containing protein n=1 Tax=Salmonella enterica TaxID=28901 RepID=UPI003F4C8E20
GNPINGGADLAAGPVAIRNAPVSTAVDLVAASDSGISDSDNLTNDSTPTVEIAVNDRGRIDVDFNNDGAFDATMQVPSAGVYNFTATAVLPDGRHSVT